MLQSVNHLHGFAIHAADGEIGKIHDLYFDDHGWTVRYLVVDTGSWLSGRRVLISPQSVAEIDWPGHSVRVALTCDQVRRSPATSADMPVSRQHEEALSEHYGWPVYWAGYPFGVEAIGFAIPLPMLPAKEAPKGDPHLRSAHEVHGYHIAAVDGPIGHVSDFVFDDQTWRIVSLVADAGSWLQERLLLIELESIRSIDWAERDVRVRLPREVLKSRPPFDAVFPIAPDAFAQTGPHPRPDGGS